MGKHLETNCLEPALIFREFSAEIGVFDVDPVTTYYNLRYAKRPRCGLVPYDLRAKTYLVGQWCLVRATVFFFFKYRQLFVDCCSWF